MCFTVSILTGVRAEVALITAMTYNDPESLSSLVLFTDLFTNILVSVKPLFVSKLSR